MINLQFHQSNQNSTTVKTDKAVKGAKPVLLNKNNAVKASFTDILKGSAKSGQPVLLGAKKDIQPNNLLTVSKIKEGDTKAKTLKKEEVASLVLAKKNKKEEKINNDIANTVALPTNQTNPVLKDKIKKEAKEPKLETLNTVESAKIKKMEEKPTVQQAVKTEPATPELKPVTKKEISLAKEEPKIAKTEQPNAISKEPIVLVVDKRSPDVVQNSPNQTDFKALLSQNLKETGNTEIVNRAHIIVKEADAGEIRLVLKPDQLGTVRININVEDNRILGRIVVDNPMVKTAFDDNMADLRDSMLKSGFNSAELDVNVGGSDTHEERGGHQRFSHHSTQGSVGGTENYFNTETIQLIADIVNNGGTLNVQA